MLRLSVRGRLWCGLLIGVLAAACGDDDVGGPLFDEKPECEGEVIDPLGGHNQMIISFIEIGEKEDGLDLDHDGEPDNQLFGIADFAADAITQAFDNVDIVAPIEFFDFDEPAEDDCVKFAVYLGVFKFDRDGDQTQTAVGNGDCNDLDEDINRNAAEIVGNGIDDDCDGMADEDGPSPSTDTSDADDDGVTIADGDCDDTRPEVDGSEEVCGDSLDNDCDGAADFDVSAAKPVCTPFDPDEPAEVGLDPLAFDDDGSPVIAFRSGRVVEEDGVLVLEAGPSLFKINFPIVGATTLDLQVTGATVRAELVMTPAGWAAVNGQLGGVIDAHTADDVRGLEIPEIDLDPADSLLDAIFANVLGVFLALPKPPPDREHGGCHQPDIDVDQDGIETFCDSDPDDDLFVVDTCVDGDGSIVTDQGSGSSIVHCTDAVDEDGNLRFVDGISIELNFETVPVELVGPLP